MPTLPCLQVATCCPSKPPTRESSTSSTRHVSKLQTSMGMRDNVCILKWTIKMLLREKREAVTLIDYTVAFDTENQLFLDEALSCTGVSVKVRRIISFKEYSVLPKAM